MIEDIICCLGHVVIIHTVPNHDVLTSKNTFNLRISTSVADPDIYPGSPNPHFSIPDTGSQI
jgi:hypothetical protein